MTSPIGGGAGRPLSRAPIWNRSWRADPRGRVLADRHYTRQKHGAKQFVPPGSCVVLLTPCGRGLWITSAPKREYVKHAWAGAWVCAMFRNEGAGLSSEMIRAAVRETIDHYGDVPWRGMVTFVDPAKTASRRSRRSQPGECFLRAGFKHVGYTKTDHLPALVLHPSRMPGLPPYVPTEASPARIGGREL